jgi:hypothetical protein
MQLHGITNMYLFELLTGGLFICKLIAYHQSTDCSVWTKQATTRFIFFCSQLFSIIFFLTQRRSIYFVCSVNWLTILVCSVRWAVKANSSNTSALRFSNLEPSDQSFDTHSETIVCSTFVMKVKQSLCRPGQPCRFQGLRLPDFKTVRTLRW